MSDFKTIPKLLFDKYPVQFPLDELLVMIIGYNGSGKTKLLELMRDYYIEQKENVLYFPCDRILDITYEDARRALDTLESLTIMNQLSENGYNMNLFKKWGLDLDRLEFDMKWQYNDYISSGLIQVVNFLTKIINGQDKQIVMIDLPERSLHIHIKRTFIEDILNIPKVSQLIVVTHCPEIISSNWNEAYDIEKFVDISKRI